MSIATTTGVSSGDVRRMLDLIAGVTRAAGTPVARFSLVMRGLIELTSAKVCVIARVRRSAHASVQIESMVDSGWPSAEHRAAVMSYTNTAYYRDEPLEVAFDRLLSSSSPSLTFRRQDLIDDAAWYASPHFNGVRQHAHIDDCIYSIYPLPGVGHYACLGLHRAYGQPLRFTERDRLIADFIWQALGFLHEQPLAQSPLATHRAATPGSSLPLELQPVLAVLRLPGPLAGAERKLGLTPAAFRHRCRRIYRHFGVPSRTALILKCHEAA